MLVLGQGLRLGAHVAPEGGEALDSCSARGTGCFDGRMLMVLECFHVILPGSFGSGHRIRRNQTSRDSGINVTIYQSVLIFITSCDQAVLEVFSLFPTYCLSLFLSTTGTPPPPSPGQDSTSQFMPTRLARIPPDSNRHQAWDDQGLGIRRSGVLLSHARANGSLPIP